MTETQKEIYTPDHYRHGRYETLIKMLIIFGPVKTKAFCDLNVFKYIDRESFKHWRPEDDREKADFYAFISSKIDESKSGPENALSVKKALEEYRRRLDREEI